MPIDVYCPQCGKHYNVGDEKAGLTARCAQCGSSFTVPEVHSPLQPPSSEPEGDTYGIQEPEPLSSQSSNDPLGSLPTGPVGGDASGYSEFSDSPYAPPTDDYQQVGGYPAPAGYNAAAEGVRTHCTVLGILNVVLAVLTLGWLAYLILVMVVQASGELPQGPDDPPMEVMMTIFAGWALLTLVQCVVQGIAGYMLLVKSSGCRMWGIIAGVVNCVSFWSCCLYPLALGAGIYSLIILLSENARHTLDR